MLKFNIEPTQEMKDISESLDVYIRSMTKVAFEIREALIPGEVYTIKTGGDFTLSLHESNSAKECYDLVKGFYDFKNGFKDNDGNVWQIGISYSSSENAIILKRGYIICVPLAGNALIIHDRTTKALDGAYREIHKLKQEKINNGRQEKNSNRN